MGITFSDPDVDGDSDITSWAAITRAAGFDAFVQTPTSANFRALVTDETGSGLIYFQDGALGTPSSGVLTNATGLPVSTGLVGLGAGVAAALGVNVGFAGAPVLFNGALGTPSSATLTNATGLPVSTGVSGLGTGVATFLATPSSANLRAAVTDEVGSGALYFVGGALGTPASATLTNATGLPTAGIVTTATNDDAAAGKIGEYLSQDVLVGSAVSMTSGSAITIASISLTAGDWTVHGGIVFVPAASTVVSRLISAISPTTDAFGYSNPAGGGMNSFAASFVTGTPNHVLSSGTRRVSLASTTTIYLVGFASFTTSTMTAYGFIGARRER